MNKEEQSEHYEQIQEYLQKNNVYGMLSQLVQELILEQPADVLDFFIRKLQTPEKITLFVVGPPGLSINATIKKTLASSERSFELFNCGEEIASVQAKLGQEQQSRFRACRLVDQGQIEDIVGKLQKLAKSEKNSIIEGFPKNLKQALLLQKRGVYVKNVLIININKEGLQQLCEQKLRSFNPELEQKQLGRLAAEAIAEHHVFLREIKRFYQQYWEIDLSHNRQEQFVLQELHKAFTIKTIQPSPRTATQILIMGAPLSGRTTLGKKVAAHYSFVYLSTSCLIAEEVRKDSIHGRKIKQHYLNHELIDNFLVQKLIEERIAEKDCQMQGVVIEGYPKTKEQFDNLKTMKLQPSLIVAIDSPLELSQSRSTVATERLQSRHQNWRSLATHLAESKEKIFWVEPRLSIGNLFEEVVHEFEKQFI